MQKNKIANRIHLMMKQAKILKPHYTSMADIGTDHGYLPYLMHADGMINSSILCDINKGPLENAKKTFEKNLKYSVDFRLGSGIEPLSPHETELVVIAGMGGGLIQEILLKDLDKSKSFPYYLIQPMTEQQQLRQFLLNHNFNILWDSYFTDSNKHYELLIVSTHEENPLIPKDDFISIPCSDLEFGFKIRKSQIEAYYNFLENKKNKYLHILNQISNDSMYDTKILECETKLKNISSIELAFKSL
ncbi:tRNA (adenine(22)-N(1))-methyltransferase [Fusibacter bizertensis]